MITIPRLSRARTLLPCEPTVRNAARLAVIGMAILASMAASQTMQTGERSAEVPAAAIIAEEGFQHSEVADTSAYLADRIGGRLTNSPSFWSAHEWVRERLQGWGLRQVWSEPFAFGRGWSAGSWSLTMTSPRRIQLRSIPVAWTPGTAGPVTASVVIAPMANDAALGEWHGRLAGKGVLVSAVRGTADNVRPPFSRLNAEELAAADRYGEAEIGGKAIVDARYERQAFERRRDAFLKREGAVAWIRMSTIDDGRVRGDGYFFPKGQTPSLPGMEVSAEDYRRLARLAGAVDVQVTLSVDAAFHDGDDGHSANLLADLPGTKGRGYVMAGAHLDSWVAGDGAADNGAGVAIVMEAARILRGLHRPPRRTIRFAFWAGEEQGLLGSAAYVARHLATRPASTDPERRPYGPFYDKTWPVRPLPGYSEMLGYFNVDGGSGRIRGVRAENNLAAKPILRRWLEPLASMGAGSVLTRRAGGSDQQLMSEIGLPSFPLLQDPLDYDVIYHDDIDAFDHLRTDDLKQAAVVLASLLWAAANDEETLPRRPIPVEAK